MFLSEAVTVLPFLTSTSAELPLNPVGAEVSVILYVPVGTFFTVNDVEFDDAAAGTAKLVASLLAVTIFENVYPLVAFPVATT